MERNPNVEPQTPAAPQATPSSSETEDQVLRRHYETRKAQFRLLPDAAPPLPRQALDQASGSRRQRSNCAEADSPRPTAVWVRSPTHPPAHNCQECGGAYPYQQLATLAADPSRSHDERPAPPATVLSWKRALCLCEVRRQEQREAAEADERTRRKTEQAEVAQIHRRARIARNITASGLAHGRLARQTFAAYDPDRCAEQRTAHDALLAWAEAWDRRTTERGIVLASLSSGCGKTHLCAAAGHLLLERGASVRFFATERFLNAIRREFDSKKNSEDEWVGQTLDAAIRADVLILDDFGTERIQTGEKGDWARLQIYTLLNERETAGRPVLASTNKSMDEIADHYSAGDETAGNRITSRLSGLCRLIEMDGPDGRQFE